jgi:TRAP-type uncharacterized transport system fused permease subunit
MDRDRDMFTGRLMRDEYLEGIDRNLQQINARQRRDHIRANGGMTGGDAIVALIVYVFRKMRRMVRRVLLALIAIFIVWCVFGEAIVGALHNARQQSVSGATLAGLTANQNGDMS